MGDSEKSVEQRLELLGTVALLTVTAVMKVVENQHPVLTDEQREKLGLVRDDVTRALVAIDEHLAGTEPDGDNVDLTGLRDRLAQILESLGKTTDEAPLPS